MTYITELPDEFISEKSPYEITNLFEGRQLKSVRVIEKPAEDWIRFTFTEGHYFEIRFSWLYEWAAGIDKPTSAGES